VEVACSIALQLIDNKITASKENTGSDLFLKLMDRL